MKKYADLVVGLIIMVAMAAAIGLGYYWGSSDKQAEWDTAELKRSRADMQAVDTRLQSNANTVREQAVVNEMVRKELQDEQKAIADERNRVIAGGLRLPASTCPGPARPTKATSTSGSHASTAGTGPLPENFAQDVQPESVPIPADLADDLIQTAVLGDEVVASCRALQEFVRKNGLAP